MQRLNHACALGHARRRRLHGGGVAAAHHAAEGQRCRSWLARMAPQGQRRWLGPAAGGPGGGLARDGRLGHGAPQAPVPEDGHLALQDQHKLRVGLRRDDHLSPRELVVLEQCRDGHLLPVCQVSEHGHGVQERPQRRAAEDLGDAAEEPADERAGDRQGPHRRHRPGSQGLVAVGQPLAADGRALSQDRPVAVLVGDLDGTLLQEEHPVGGTADRLVDKGRTRLESLWTEGVREDALLLRHQLGEDRVSIQKAQRLVLRPLLEAGQAAAEARAPYHRQEHPR
mmetsp:Transcript_68144/g.184073  ORF Transcript_68144/g.184073 Transcript_68144/m.184073 type:complete len:283 (+) Transcript_68144:958-1806(+)